MKLTDIIAPHFYSLHHDIKEEQHTHYKLSGGRGSTKSSFVSVEIILGMMKDPDANAIVFRKVKDTLKESVYEQLLWAIDMLGAGEYWTAKLSPLRLIYKDPGREHSQQIIFRGLDDPLKQKSIKSRHGYFKFIWFEEWAEFSGVEETDNVLQSLMRGGDKFFVFYSWNPPKTIDAWINQDVIVPQADDTIVLHTTYLTVPPEWLGKPFLLEAEKKRKRNPVAYRHEYLGEATGNGGKVFDNVIGREITDGEISAFDRIRQGIDFGFAADPFAYIRMHYNKKKSSLYIFGEIYQANLKTKRAVEMIRKYNPENAYITADPEEPRSIADLNDYGLRVIKAKKGPGSVDFGMNFLQNLDEIIIDPVRCPNTYREFSTYELERDRNGNFRGSYPDKNNHSIDAVRYALESDMTKKKAKIKDKKKLRR